MFYSENKKQFTVLNRRTFFLYLLKISLFGLVGWRLYNIQIKESDKYRTLSHEVYGCSLADDIIYDFDKDTLQEWLLKVEKEVS